MHLPFRALALLPLLFAGLTGPGLALSPEVEASIRARQAEGTLQALALVLVDGPSVKRHFFGPTRAIGGREVNDRTLFEIGSISKVFTALLLQQTVDEGLIALDDPIEPFLPMGVSCPKGGEGITFRHLASHRSGLPRLPANLAPKLPSDPYADYDAAALWAYLPTARLDRRPGEGYAYSNLGVGLLGQLMTLIHGRSYGELLRDQITKPLAMTDTVLRPDGEQERRQASPLGPAGECSPWSFDALAGCGAIRSTPADMLRFLRACLGEGPSSIEKALRRCGSEPTPTGAPGLSIALGWHVWERFGTRIVWHNGGTMGCRSFLGFIPGQKRAVLLLSTAPEGHDDLALHLLHSKWPLTPRKQFLKLTAAELDAFVGVYDLPEGGSFTIRRRGRVLEAQLTGQSFLPVYPTSPRFFSYRAVKATLSFDGTEGRAENLTLHQGTIRLKARRRP